MKKNYAMPSMILDIDKVYGASCFPENIHPQFRILYLEFVETRLTRYVSTYSIFSPDFSPPVKRLSSAIGMKNTFYD